MRRDVEAMPLPGGTPLRATEDPMEFLDNLSMEVVYVGCAILGGTILALQTVMQLFGFGDMDGDAPDVDVDDVGVGDDAFSVLSVRAISSFFLFFGLAGWGGSREGWGTFPVALVALACGVLVMLLVAWILSFQRRLQSQGNIDPENAVGLAARVYLRVPGRNGGQGKVTVRVQERTAEFTAVTSGPDLPTGAQCRIVRITSPGIFEVEALG